MNKKTPSVNKKTARAGAKPPVKPAKQAKAKVTKDMTIGDVVAKYPSSIEVLLSNGIHCVGCSVKYYETLEQGMLGHGMSMDDVNKVVGQINDAIAGDEEPSADESGKDFIVTKKAAAKILELLKREKKTGHGLRISIIPGGCSGFSYGLEFDNNQSKEDIVIEENGVKILIDGESLKMVKGAKMDYVDTLQGAGFKITNPNAMSTCGCGQSFR